MNKDNIMNKQLAALGGLRTGRSGARRRFEAR